MQSFSWKRGIPELYPHAGHNWHYMQAWMERKSWVCRWCEMSHISWISSKLLNSWFTWKLCLRHLRHTWTICNEGSEKDIRDWKGGCALCKIFLVSILFVKVSYFNGTKVPCPIAMVKKILTPSCPLSIQSTLQVLRLLLMMFEWFNRVFLDVAFPTMATTGRHLMKNAFIIALLSPSQECITHTACISFLLARLLPFRRLGPVICQNARFSNFEDQICSITLHEYCDLCQKNGFIKQICRFFFDDLLDLQTTSKYRFTAT